mmetsp:Transcript_22967/g.71252  ORF Transcript_22967/g.71252 Transcript_22967/m.71252 type:complete len:240 (+) Transcript_22967:2-721(+)
MKLCTAAFVPRAAACTASTNAVATASELSPWPRTTEKLRRARTTRAVRCSVGSAPGQLALRFLVLRDERLLRTVEVSSTSGCPSSLVDSGALSMIQFGRCGRYASRFDTMVSSDATSFSSAPCSSSSAHSPGPLTSCTPSPPGVSEEASSAAASSFRVLIVASASSRRAPAVSYRAIFSATRALSRALARARAIARAYSSCIAWTEKTTAAATTYIRTHTKNFGANCAAELRSRSSAGS